MKQKPFRKEYSNDDNLKLLENEYDEPVDRFEKGQTFQNDPYLMKDENHFSSSTMEDPFIRRSRKSLGTEEDYLVDANDSATDNVDQYQEEDLQSSMIDPNLGPVPNPIIEESNDVQP